MQKIHTMKFTQILGVNAWTLDINIQFVETDILLDFINIFNLNINSGHDYYFCILSLWLT